MKTKYIKIAVSERLPETIDSNIIFFTKKGNVKTFYNAKYLKRYEPNYEEEELEFFLEEIPDREEEMIEMLEESQHVIENAILEVGAETTYQLKIASGKISSLLQSLITPNSGVLKLNPSNP